MPLGVDGSFGLDKYGNVKVVTEGELVKNVLTFILFARPGQYPSLPHIGLNIQDKLYSSYDELDESVLATQIVEQCSELGNYFRNGDISIKKTRYYNQPALMIYVNSRRDLIGSPVDKKDEYRIGISIDEAKKLNIVVNGGELAYSRNEVTL